MTLTREAALQELCVEQWPAIDRQVAEELELPEWETAEPTRRQLFQKFRSDPRVSDYDPSDASDRHLLAQEFQRQALPTAQALAQATVEAVIRLSQRTLTAILRRPRVKNVPKAPGRRPARLRKADARNLELLSFVVERIIPFAQLFEKRLDKHGKDVRLLPGHRGPQVAVPRQALADEWNPPHPWWPMKSGDELMKQFYRAAARPHLCRGFLQQVESEILAEWTKREAVFTRLRESFARLSDAELAKRAAPMDEARIREWEASPQGQARRAELEAAYKALQDSSRRVRERFPSEEDYQAWRARRDAEREQEYRAGLTRKDLIEEREERLFLCQIKEDPQEGWQLLQSPLRDWFLPEARGERMRFQEPGRFWRLMEGGESAPAAKPQTEAKPPTSPPNPRRRPKPAPSDAKPPRTRTVAKSSRASRTSRRPR